MVWANGAVPTCGCSFSRSSIARYEDIHSADPSKYWARRCGSDACMLSWLNMDQDSSSQLSMAPKSGVLVGAGENLFLFAGEHHKFEFLTGRRKPTAQDIANFVGNLEDRAAYCAYRKIPYVHLVFPAKPVVLRSLVPAPWREEIQSLFLSSYAPALAASAAGAVYPLEELAAADHQSRVFRLRDTHLTDHGSFTVADLLLRRWGRSYTLADHFTAGQQMVSGDLGLMLGDGRSTPEKTAEPQRAPLVFDNHLFLPGNTGNLAVLRNQPAESRGRLLIFGDSFIKESLKFLLPAFKEILYVRSATFQADIVEQFGPDAIVTSNTERYLSDVRSDRESRSFLLDFHGSTTYAPSATFVAALKAQLSWTHHRAEYLSWESRLCVEEAKRGLIRFPDLGDWAANDHVEIVDVERGGFRSVGNDPAFVFPNTPLQTGRYFLELDLMSDVESDVAIYYMCPDSIGYSEDRVLRQPIRVGRNQVSFDLTGLRLGPALRIDPLSARGTFRITGLRLIPVHS